MKINKSGCNDMHQRFKVSKDMLLASDIDGTLLGDILCEKIVSKFIELNRDFIKLIYITGRSLKSVIELVDNFTLPKPDMISSSVGTELYLFNDKPVLVEQFYQNVKSVFDLNKIYKVGTGDGVWPQSFPDGQPRFQAGFYWDGKEDCLKSFQSRLSIFEGLEIISSQYKYIDVIPSALGKGNVVKFIKSYYNITSDVVVSGDSGNDVSLLNSGYKAIIPSNYQKELHPFLDPINHFISSYSAPFSIIDGLMHYGFVKEL